MCGFAGLIFSNHQSKQQFSAGLSGFRQAASRIANRGDTDHQEFIDDNIWLSHYRLAFQDVNAGIQPMRSQDGKHIIIFNGEVYNHLQLRDQIIEKSGYQFKTRSDTETILQGWKVFGADFFNQFDGEFAFVIINLDGSGLIAHRDHFGVKPLFFRLADIDNRMFANYAKKYTFNTTRFEFASEIKGLASDKSWNRSGLLRQYVGLYEPICTPFDHIIQIPPGSLLTAHKNADGFSTEIITNHNPVRQRSRNVEAASEQDSEQDFENAFRQSVNERMLSDVELGVYLSGGVDSKAVAYELARASKKSQNLKSFTVGFNQNGYDESQEALRFSKHLGFNPHLIFVDDEALNYSYPLSVQSSELVQPYTNGSAKWWLSLFSRQYVQGVLTGDGADEVLCGYPSYRYASWWKQTMRQRGQAHSVDAVNSLLQKTPLGKSQRDGVYVGRFSADKKNPWLSGSSAEGNGQDFIDSLNILGIPHPLFGQIHAITSALLGDDANDWLSSQAESVRSWFAAGLDGVDNELANPEHSLLLWQNYFAKTHLPVLILNWVGDRMEMANTLEGRTPFMSKPVRDLILKQPDRNMISGLKDKVLLRRTYARLFPAEFAQTPKKQFNAPFVKSNELIEKFNTREIFETTGLTDNSVFHNLEKNSQQSNKSNPYLMAHLQSAYQTAICLSIVNSSITDKTEIKRDKNFENMYLNKGGPVSH